MVNFGFGGHKSIGKGQFEILSFGEFNEINIPDNPNAFLLISSMLPSSTDPTNGYYDTLIKYGKLDREYAVSDNPFKKPLIMLKAGSVFKVEDKVKDFYGRMAEGVSSINKNIVQYGLGFSIPIIY